MPYLRLDDNCMQHPKVQRLSDPAFRVWMEGLTYCARLMTDGFVPRRLALSWGSLKRVGELTASGLWSERQGGYEVHDYLEWNDSRQTIQDRRRKDSLRKSGRHPPGFPGVGVGVGKEQEESFARFWKACPKREGPGLARNIFCALLDAGFEAETLIAGAERWAEHVAGTDPTFIAKPANWLTAEGWLDEYGATSAPLSPAEMREKSERDIAAFLADPDKAMKALSEEEG